VLVEQGKFFSGAAVVTFGGAYAVLAYVAQQAVNNYHWLTGSEMVHGLALAEILRILWPSRLRVQSLVQQHLPTHRQGNRERPDHGPVDRGRRWELHCRRRAGHVQDRARD